MNERCVEPKDVGSRSWGNLGKRIICTPSLPSFGSETFLPDDFQVSINGVHRSRAVDTALAQKRWRVRKGLSSVRVRKACLKEEALRG